MANPELKEVPASAEQELLRIMKEDARLRTGVSTAEFENADPVRGAELQVKRAGLLLGLDAALSEGSVVSHSPAFVEDVSGYAEQVRPAMPDSRRRSAVRGRAHTVSLPTDGQVLHEVLNPTLESMGFETPGISNPRRLPQRGNLFDLLQQKHFPRPVVKA